MSRRSSDRAELARIARSILPSGTRIGAGPVAMQLHSSFRCTLPDGTTAWLKFDRERFVEAGVEREAACLAELGTSSFDHVPQLLDAGRAYDGTPFMVTLHLDGTRLDDHLAREGTADWHSVVDWLWRWNGLGDGDRVHGSFDTRNILLLEDGSLSGIIDFEAHRSGSIECDLASLITDVTESCVMQLTCGALRHELKRLVVAVEETARRELDSDQIVALSQLRIHRRLRAEVIDVRSARAIASSIVERVGRS